MTLMLNAPLGGAEVVLWLWLDPAHPYRFYWVLPGHKTVTSVSAARRYQG